MLESLSLLPRLVNIRFAFPVIPVLDKIQNKSKTVKKGAAREGCGARPSSAFQLLPVADCEETEYHGRRGGCPCEPRWILLAIPSLFGRCEPPKPAVRISIWCAPARATLLAIRVYNSPRSHNHSKIPVYRCSPFPGSDSVSSREPWSVKINDY